MIYKLCFSQWSAEKGINYSQYCKKPNENYICSHNRFKGKILYIFALTNNYINSDLCG